MAGTRPRRLALALALLTATSCLLILEGGVRFDDWLQSRKPRGAPQDLPLLRENPNGTGSYRLRPNLDLETRVGASRIHIKTNSHGMHWRETSLAGTPGRPRVAFLGDSFTFGSWAADSAHSFVGVFESSLPAGRVEALNFGVGGYGLVDEELLLREVALRFDLSYVIVVSYMGNDFRDTWLGLDRETIVNGTARLDMDNLAARVPAAYRTPDDRIPLPCPDQGFRLIASRSAAFRRLAPLLDLENLCVIFRPNMNFVQPAFWSRLPAPDVALKAKDAVLESLDRMKALAAEHRVRLAVVALPTAAQVYAQTPWSENFDTALPQAYLREFCRDQKIPYLDLLPLLRRLAAASNRRMYLKADIHLNDFGHARVGALIAEWFEQTVRER